MYKYDNNLDIRILHLGKWQIPKTTKFNADESNKNKYLSMGYFDLIDVVCAKYEDDSHPFLRAYNDSPRRKAYNSEKQEGLMEEYTTQELMIFTNIEEEGILSENSITEFWEKASLLLCVSLIHIDNDSDIDAILDRINNIFAGKMYLYYFSFDYSGIVLLVKENSINCFTEMMFKLNFNTGNGIKLIRDSYSFYGFDNDQLGKLFRSIEEQIEIETRQTGEEPCYEQIAKAIYETCEDGFENRFSATVNIGIQNYNGYIGLKRELEKTGAKLYGLLGRHDVSVVKEEADLAWLVYIHYLLDKYTVSSGTNCFNFIMHETFVKIADEWSIEEGEPLDIREVYKNARELLGKYCDDFVKNLDSKRYNGQYKTPVRAVQYSILSIMKNGFAEDFVLCMYKPFISFLEYLTKKMISKADDPICFNECYNDFFMCINSLVNSAMHSERQFIQATAFNAIINDVPAKIMAFYMAIIDDIQNLMRKTDEKETYTFLLTPSFSNEISVRTISYKEEPQLPHGRLLRVAINEESLYNPPSVIRRMAHEIAHYAGDELRNREERKRCVENALLHIILTEIIHNSLIRIGKFGDDLLKNIMKILKLRDCLAEEEDNYSKHLGNLPALIIYEMQNNHAIYEGILEYVENTLGVYYSTNYKEKDSELEKYISDVAIKYTGDGTNLLSKNSLTDEKLYIVSSWIVKDIYEDLQYIDEEIQCINIDRNLLPLEGGFNQSIVSRQKDKPLRLCTLTEYMESLLSMYSEAYADIQMILLTKISYEDYLMSFIKGEGIDLTNFLNSISDIGRVTTVSMLMYCVGIWQEVENGSMGEDRDICQLHDSIRTGIHDIISIMSKKDKERYFTERKSLGYDFLEETGDAITTNLPRDEVSVENVERCFAVIDAQEDKVKAYINRYLAEYLGKCISDTIKEYENGKVGQVKKTELIKELRKKIKTVNECKNIKRVFEEICRENCSYRETLFSMRSE